MNIADLKRDIVKDKLRNLYVFTGDEVGIMNMYLKQIKQKVVWTSSFLDVARKLNNNSLFDSNKDTIYVVYQDDSLLKMDTEKIRNLIGTSHIILVYPHLDKRSKFKKAFESDLIEFKPLTRKQLIYYITKKVDISDRVAGELVDLCGGNFTRINLELDKLVRLGPISINTIYDNIAPAPKDVIFDFCNAVVSKKQELSFDYLVNLKYRNESSIKILSILYTTFRNTMIVQAQKNKLDKDIAAKYNISIWIVKNIRKTMGKFSLNQLVKIMDIIQHAEQSIKTGKLEEAIGVEYTLIYIFAVV
ncbi:clamp loader of DNA polymerase [Clostridium phage phiCTP1]|uniref:clamp loader of DNA polymerase n=1 Tax=Clostridium phage phiCTP1 TaxID=871584 RepID=UPI0001E07854|nr:clamp loader of DNA polymerase [Clostridium phage phiCTP1]ADL40368.1 putative DNA polymerase III [Clostridium phage phiCTP1]